MGYEDVKKSANSMSWGDEPQIKICKYGLCFNRAFSKAFGYVNGDYINILVDVINKKVAFRKPKTDIDVQNAYKCTQSYTKASCFTIGCKRVNKTFPEKSGKRFVASLNEVNGFVEVELTKESGS